MASTRSIELDKSINMMRVVAVGGPGSRNKSGMIVVVSLQTPVAIEGTQTRISENLKIFYF